MKGKEEKSHEPWTIGCDLDVIIVANISFVVNIKLTLASFTSLIWIKIQRLALTLKLFSYSIGVT